MSLIDYSTVVPVTMLEDFVSRFGWHRGRKANPDPHLRLLDRAGYDVSDFTIAIISEFANLNLIVNDECLFWYIRDGQILGEYQTGTVKVGAKISSRWYWSHGECEIVNSFFLRHLGTSVIRVGTSDYTRRDGGNLGDSGIGLIFYNGSEVFELLVCDVPFIKIYSTFANYLALKCIPLQLLNGGEVHNACRIFPPPELDDDVVINDSLESLRRWFGRVCYW